MEFLQSSTHTKSHLSCSRKLKRWTVIPGCSDNTKMRALWKAIWDLKYPSEIKHFVWRACRNILTIKHCLQRWKVIMDDKCNLCRERETLGHILWSCETAKETWDVLNIKVTNLNSSIEEFIDVVWLLREDEGDKDWEVIATNVWSLWNNRNAIRHDGQCKQGKVIATEVQKYVEEFHATKPINPPKATPPPKR